MKHLPTYTLSFLVGICLLLPGCTRYMDWFSDVFNQGCKQPTYSCQVQQYIRSVRIYDQLNTLGLFDALWLHPCVREAYLQAYGSTRCLSDQQVRLLEQQQDYELEHYIQFYLLGATSDGELLNDSCSEWHVSLVIDGCCFMPIEIKTVDLCGEYKRFFGPWFTIFKDQYLITFNALDEFGNSLLHPGVRSMELVMSRLGTRDSMVWCLDDCGNITNCSSFNKDILAYDLQTNI